MKPTGPGSLSHIICLCDLFYLPFISGLLNLKIQKFLAALYFIWCSIYKIITTLPRPFANFWHRYPKGIDNPLTRGVARSCYLCAGDVYVVLAGSPTGSITLVSSLREIPTIAVLHRPFLFEEIPT